MFQTGFHPDSLAMITNVPDHQQTRPSDQSRHLPSRPLTDRPVPGPPSKHQCWSVSRVTVTARRSDECQVLPQKNKRERQKRLLLATHRLNHPRTNLTVGSGSGKGQILTPKNFYDSTILRFQNIAGAGFTVWVLLISGCPPLDHPPLDHPPLDHPPRPRGVHKTTPEKPNNAL